MLKFTKRANSLKIIYHWIEELLHNKKRTSTKFVNYKNPN